MLHQCSPLDSALSSMIDLGLARVTRLLGELGNPQNCYKAFHVAGTNGKGSVVSYLSSILTYNGVRTGRFTSPFLINEEDAICINNRPITRQLYEDVKKAVDALNIQKTIQATEFEREAATAFEVFRREKVEVAVIEVGLGGLLDATNVLMKENVLCTAITKIAFDHEGFLGSSLTQIATQKAGIIKPGVPCVADGTNDTEVLQVVKSVADMKSSLLYTPVGLPVGYSTRDILEGEFQKQNAAVAVQSISVAYPQFSRGMIIEGLRNTTWPGRLQWIDMGNQRVLVDGAHNPSAAIELAKYVQEHMRPKSPITWVVAFSKPCDDILAQLVQPGDKVIATKFGSIATMPWIKSLDPNNICESARKYTEESNVTQVANIKDVYFNDNTVICGSLYLLRELYR